MTPTLMAVDHAPTLRAQYDAMIATMGLARSDHPLQMVPGDDGSAHVIPLADGGWLYQVTERGQALEQRTFADTGSLLYHLARLVVAREGSRHQASQPSSGRDPRRADFAHRLYLMGKVSPEWRSRLAEEMANWLTRHPYVDDVAAPPSPGGQGKGWLGLLLVGALVATWGAAHVPLAMVWRAQDRLEEAGLPARALVTGHHRTDGRFADTYRLEFAYTVAGQAYVASDEIDWQAWHASDYPGAQVDIVYDPQSPGDAMVAGNDRAGRLAWVYGAIDALLGLIILRGWLRLRREADGGLS